MPLNAVNISFQTRRELTVDRALKKQERQVRYWTVITQMCMSGLVFLVSSVMFACFFHKRYNKKRIAVANKADCTTAYTRL